MELTHAGMRRALSVLSLLLASCGSEEDEGPVAPSDASLPTIPTDSGAAADAGKAEAGKGEPDEPVDATPDAGADRPDADVPVDPDRQIDAGEEPDTATPDAGEEPDAGEQEDPGIARGKALAGMFACTSCHQPNYAGLAFYPNITPHVATGIGGWTDAEIGSAITKGVDAEGESLCGLMQRYDFDASELEDLIAFLRSLPPVSNVVSSVCPGHGT